MTDYKRGELEARTPAILRYNEGNTKMLRRCDQHPGADRRHGRSPVMRIIPLTRGYFTFVDDEDYDDLAQFNWHFHSRGYASRHKGILEDPNGAVQLMHRRIMDNPKDKQIDHVNGNKLDNRRCNLRICEFRAQNAYNVPKKLGAGSSKYKGLTWLSERKKWQVKIRGKRITRTLGYFENEYIAALAYDRAAREYHGTFAWLNFPNITDYSEITATPSKAKSGFYGVYQRKTDGKWRASIAIAGKNIHVGDFDTPQEAAMARDRAVHAHPECNGKLNFREGQDA